MELIFSFLTGAIVGSFLNVVIYRLPRRRSIVRPSSRCGYCRSAIPFWMNIPLLSYLLSAGRCVRCGYIYSIRYFVVELLTGLMFAALVSLYGIGVESGAAALFGSFLIVASFIDLDLRIIPDEISLGGWLLFILLALAGIGIEGIHIWESIFASLIGYLAFWILSRAYYILMGEEGLGGGDVKLMGLIGAALGLKAVLSTVLVGSVLGAFVGLLLILFLGKGRRFPIPFGPFLAMGAFSVLFKLDFWWSWL